MAELKRQVGADLATPHDPLDLKIVTEIIKRAKTHVAFQPILRKLLPT